MRLITLCLTLFIVFFSCSKDKDKPSPDTGIPPPLPPGVEPRIPKPAPNIPGSVSFARFESDKLDFLGQVNANDRLNTRFLSVCEQFNEGNKVEPFINAVNKTLNSISIERDIALSRSTGLTGCVCAIDLRDYGITISEWNLIVQENPFKRTFESFTSRGILIKQLTQTRQDWLPAHVFSFTAFDANVYPWLLDLPTTLSDLQIFLGIDTLQDNFDQEDRETYLFGMTRSPIAIGKPRMALRTTSRDGFYYQTYDVVTGNVGLRDKNIFQSPFPVEARSQNTINPDGVEVIFSLPNRMLGFFLADAAGNRQNFAPLDLVVDTEASALALDPTIRYLSCNRCHSQGIIERSDEIFAKVRNDNSFNNFDVQKSAFWHGRPAGLSAAVRQDNQIFYNSLQGINIGSNEPDFVNLYTDRLRQESDINQLAALMFINPQEFDSKLRGTVASINEIGAVLNGDKVSFDQIQRTLQLFVFEANIFRDDFGE